MDPHLRGQQIDAFDERERLFSGQRGRGGVLRTSQAGVLPQEKLRGCFDGRVHRHAERLHGLVPGQADQDRVRASWTGGASSASWHNQKAGTRKSNKTVPPPNLKILLNINSNDLSEEESQQLDVSYVQNWSVLGGHCVHSPYYRHGSAPQWCILEFLVAVFFDYLFAADLQGR